MKPARINKGLAEPVRKVRPDMDRKHLDNVKSLPCCVCGSTFAIDPHHLLHMDHGPNGRGMGRKAADRWAVPLCRRHHDAAHRNGDDEAYLAGEGVNARDLANELWSNKGNLEAMARVVFRCLQNAKLKRAK